MAGAKGGRQRSGANTRKRRSSPDQSDEVAEQRGGAGRTARRRQPVAEDQWRSGLDMALKGIEEVLVAPITASAESWEANSNIDDDALEEADPDNVDEAVAEKIDELITWARGAYVEACGGSSPTASRFARHHEGTLRFRLLAEVADADEPLSDYFEVQKQLRAAVDENSSLGNAAKKFAVAFARGFAGDPTVLVDAAVELFGESPEEKQMKALLSQDAEAQRSLAASVESVCHAIDAAVVEWWTEKVVPETRGDLGANDSSSRLWQWAAGSLVVGLVGAVGYWHLWSRPATAPASIPTAAASKTTVPPVVAAVRNSSLPKGTVLRKGPGERFGKVATLKSDSSAVVLDESVPGWLKLKLEPDQVGWVVQPQPTATKRVSPENQE